MRLLIPILFTSSVFAASKDVSAPTYSKDVARIIQKNCEGCHRPGQIGPFSLTNFKEVSAFKAEIKRVTEARIMPPWSAVPGHGEFKDERRLSEADIATLARWVDAGAPMGNPKDMPAKAVFNDNWAFGEPDLIYKMPEAFSLSGNGVDEYRCFVIPSGLTEDKFIRGVEVRPGNRKIVHHVRTFADATGEARKLDAADPKPGFDCSLGMAAAYKRIGIGGWAPGLAAQLRPEDTGVLFPKGTDVVMEIHYHKNGLAESDLSTIGVYLNKGPVAHIAKSVPIANPFIKIPAGESRHAERASYTFRKDVIATSVLPHMHLLGNEMTMTAVFPDGTRKPLVWAKPYDFNWQTNYVFKEPMFLPAGTKVEVVGFYNNSESNPKNPSKPLKEIRWGEGTTEEMLVGFISYYDAPEKTSASK